MNKFASKSEDTNRTESSANYHSNRKVLLTDQHTNRPTKPTDQPTDGHEGFIGKLRLQ